MKRILFLLLVSALAAAYADAPPLPKVPFAEGTEDSFGLPLGKRPLVDDPNVPPVVVVFNQNDPESQLLAKFYAEKRGIPSDQVIGLKCSVEEAITRKEYDEQIAEPLRKAFSLNFWWTLRDPRSAEGPVETNRIRYLALMRGMPLKIVPQPDYPGDAPYTTTPIGQHNEASVDSELAVLGYQLRKISGAVNNPYFRSLASITDAHRPDIMLVCRLDGPSSAVVRRMIVDSLATEQTGLRGFAYIDARGLGQNDAGLLEGDQWLLAAAADLRRNGVPVILDNGPAMFPDGYPMHNVGLYLGWYSERVSGPFARPGFRFNPGAVAVHIHSFSATTIRSSTANWVGPLLEGGAAATLGNVFEPYLALTPHLDIFEERLRLGFTFAESAYASVRVLSWMTTFVGDPLYRPYPSLPVAGAGKSGAEWAAYRSGALRWIRDQKGGTAELKSAAQKLRSGIIWEGLGLLQTGANDHVGGLASLQEARKAYTNPEDILRAAIHEIIQLRGLGKESDAIDLAKKQAAAFPTAPAISVLQMLEPAAFPGREPAQ